MMAQPVATPNVMPKVAPSDSSTSQSMRLRPFSKRKNTIMNTTSQTKMGQHLSEWRYASSRRSSRLRIGINTNIAAMAAKNGEAIQKRAMKSTPLYFSRLPFSSVSPIQFTAEEPLAQMAKPAMAPTMLCVVLTGREYFEASASQMADEHSAQNMPNIRMSSSPRNASLSTMPLRTVEVTVPPSPTAPTNSKMPAITVACLRLMARAPTEVEKALATSLAPMPQAIAKQTKPPRMTSHRN